jgi:hypothetical protein
VQREATRRAHGADRRGRAAAGRDRQLALGHHANALEQVPSRQRDAAAGLDLGDHGASHRQMQIGRRKLETIRALDLEQHVSEHGHRAFLVCDTLAAAQDLQQVSFRDDDVHLGPRVARLVAWV